MAASTDEKTTMEARIPQTQATIIIFFLTTISNSVYIIIIFFLKLAP